MSKTSTIKEKKILVTGGLGFIGFNTVCHFAKENRVCVVDDASRLGVEGNIKALQKLNVGFTRADISDFKALREVFYLFDPDIVIHLAAQVAVTLSITNPVRDFRSNLLGSFNLAELSRHSQKKPTILYASTNKVYGCIGDEEIELRNGSYATKDASGFSEERPIAFETPYGCSKGAAEQYFIDYCKTYDVPSVVFRQSCIYGPHQYGMEDQGWVAWFVICALFDQPLSIFGDGKQVRDVLYVDDLIRLYELSLIHIHKIKGQVFNVGGGPANTLSLNGLVQLLEQKVDKKINISYNSWRLGDQKVYISNVQKAQQLLNWTPSVSPAEGVQKLLDWANNNREQIARVSQMQREYKKQREVSIVIPAKDEEANIGMVLDEVDLFMQTSPYTYEVILINDRSKDKTVEIASDYSFVKIINNKNNPGKGGALRSGFDVATGKYIVMMDADYSHDASDLPALIEEVRRHQGLVVGSRITGGSEEFSRVRAFGNIVLTWLFGFFHGRYLSDALNGYKVFHRDVYRRFEYTADTYEIEIELLANTLRLKRLVTEIPSHERARLGGKVKSSVVRHGMCFAWRIILESFRRPREKDQKEGSEQDYCWIDPAVL